LLRGQLVPISLKLVEDGSFGSMRQPDDRTGTRNHDTEDFASVISSFLLDLCVKYPADHNKAIHSLLTHLRLFLKIDENGSCLGILDERDNEFSSVYHASIILLQALPKIRVLALCLSLVKLFLGYMNSFLENSKASETPSSWPCWTTSVMLLLEILAQPTTAPFDTNDEEKLFSTKETDKKTNGDDPKGEFGRLVLVRNN